MPYLSKFLVNAELEIQLLKHFTTAGAVQENPDVLDLRNENTVKTITS